MKTSMPKSNEDQGRMDTTQVRRQQNKTTTPQLPDNRPEAATQKELQAVIGNSSRVKQTAQLVAMANAPYQLARDKDGVYTDRKDVVLGELDHGLRRPSRKRKYHKHVEAEKQRSKNIKPAAYWVAFLTGEIKARMAKSTVPVPKVVILDFPLDEDFREDQVYDENDNNNFDPEAEYNSPQPIVENAPEKPDSKYDSIFTNPTDQHAAFVKEDWTIYVNGYLFASMDDGPINELANSVYHEARHAEQAYWGAWYEIVNEKKAGYSTSMDPDILAEIMLRIEQQKPVHNLDLKLRLGELSHSAWTDFTNRDAEAHTYAAYQGDFHEEDARSVEPYETKRDE